MQQRIINTRLFGIVCAIIISFFFALPNLFPDIPTIIINNSDATELQRIEQHLLEGNIAHTWASTQHVQFTSVDEQMKARDYLNNFVAPDTELTLNLEKNTPSWLQSLGAHAMKLGLDLQGGIHFLLEVDTSHIEKNKDNSTHQQIKDHLKTHKIRYTEMTELDSGTLEIQFLNESHAAKALEALNVYSERYHLEEPQSKTLSLTKHKLDDDAASYAVNQTIHSLEKRINELGISEATIQRQGTHHISIDLPGVQDIVYAKKIIGKTATLRFQMVANQSTGEQSIPNSEGIPIPLEPNIVLSGQSISFAHAKISEGQPLVEIRLDGQADDFYQTTTERVGDRLAVIYSETQNDALIEKVISAPVIKQPLADNFVIQGSGSIQEAKDLALLLRSGALAAPVKFVEETTIGPSLGNDNITKGIVSLAVGSSIIFIFMAYYYRVFGLIANMALVLNIVMIVAILSLMGATLTLPGIAGIVLSVGMAVDANVLINERIREEHSAGLGLREAVKTGYDKALSAIVDANITTLLVTLVLFSLGSGAVKGFAITTCMGILSSIFTSVIVTQAFTDSFIKLGWIQNVSLSHDWFKHVPRIDFMGLSRQAFGFSTVLLISCLMILPLKGIHLGLDFTGGQQLTLTTNDQTTAEDVRHALSIIGAEQSQVQTYGSSQTYMIKIGHSESAVSSTAEKLTQLLPGSNVLQAEFIGPQVGSSMLTNSVIAVLVALGVTMLYVAMRFEYRFAMSAIVSLIHDPILILGIFSLTQIEFNLIALAAMLTILGYSINDTIVVYDRVRESFMTSLNLSTEEVINDAINQTLSRTVLTSCLTLAVVMALYCFGGDYLHGFSLSLAIGIIIGTYSSIYIAGSMAVKLGLKRDDLIQQPAETG